MIDDATLDTAFGALTGHWGTLDFVVHAIAFSDQAELTGRFIDTSRDNFNQLAGDLVLLAHRRGAPRRGR